MTTINPTPARKNMRNEWCAEDKVDLPDGRQARITTMKRWGGALVSDLTVGRIDITGKTIDDPGVAFFVFSFGKDFTMKLVVHEGRVTEKVINAQHVKACAMLPSLMETINLHYSSLGTLV